MKTKKLIELLQQEDPSGEEEVCVGNVDIFFVANEPAYWDGSLQVLIRDESNPYYNVEACKFVREGRKISINVLSIEDAIWNNTGITVYGDNDHNQEMVKKWRIEAIKCIRELDGSEHMKTLLTTYIKETEDE